MRDVALAIDDLRAIKASIMELTDDDDAIRDTLEGVTDLPGLMDQLLTAEAEDQARIIGLKDIIGVWETRCNRLRERCDKWRGLMHQALAISGQRTIEAASGTVTLKTVARTLAKDIDESALPSEFFAPQPPKLDKRMLLQALKDGRDVPGARLNNGGETIQIRRG